MNSVDRGTPPSVAWLLPASTLFLVFGILLGRIAQFWQPFLLPLILGLTAALLSRRWLRSAGMMMVVLCAGALLSWNAYHPQLPPEGTYAVEGIVVQEIDVDAQGQVQTLLSSVTLDGQRQHDAYWTFYLAEDELPPAELQPGVRVRMTATLYHPGGRQNPGGFDFREYLLQRGVRLGVYGAEELTFSQGASLRGWIAALRHQLTAGLMEVMGPESGVYAAAMLLGTRDFIPEDDRVAFNKLGIAHILSVSGCHVAVLAGLLHFLLQPLPLRRELRIASEGLLLGFYCLLTGGSAPVLRAACLLLWREYTRLQHRQQLSLHLLCVTAFLQLLFNPTQLTSPSFQLTYGAMLGLLLVYPCLRQRLVCRTPFRQRAWNALSAAIAAQLGILAPQLYWFGELPLFSILLNMFVVTLAGWLLLLYWITLAALPFPGMNLLLGSLSDLTTQLMLLVIRGLANLPLTSLWTRQADFIVIVGSLLLLLSLSTLFPAARSRSRRTLLIAGTCMALTILLPLPHTGTTFTMLSVGSEDAAVLQDRNTTVVIDVGESGQALASFLHQRRESIELLILTHLHIDHASGLRALLDTGIPIEVCCLPFAANLPVIDEELLPLLAELADTGTEFRILSRGDRLPLPSGCITVLWPEEGRVFPQHDANDVCLVLHAELNGATMLLTGDLTGVYEPYVQTPVDILKVAHHGSALSTSPAFLAAADPQLLLLSNGDEARDERIRSLAGPTPLYAASQTGGVTITFHEHGRFTVETTLK